MTLFIFFIDHNHFFYFKLVRDIECTTVTFSCVRLEQFWGFSKRLVHNMTRWTGLLSWELQKTDYMAKGCRHQEQTCCSHICTVLKHATNNNTDRDTLTTFLLECTFLFWPRPRAFFTRAPSQVAPDHPPPPPVVHFWWFASCVRWS